MTVSVIKGLLEAVAEDLKATGLTLILSASYKTTADAWCDATEKHGERVALIHLCEGSWTTGYPRYRDDRTDTGWVLATTLKVSYPWEDVEAGAAIRDALAARGFDVEWKGDGQRAIVITL